MSGPLCPLVAPPSLDFSSPLHGRGPWSQANLSKELLCVHCYLFVHRTTNGLAAYAIARLSAVAPCRRLATAPQVVRRIGQMEPAMCHTYGRSRRRNRLGNVSALSGGEVDVREALWASQFRNDCSRLLLFEDDMSTAGWQTPAPRHPAPRHPGQPAPRHPAPRHPTPVWVPLTLGAVGPGAVHCACCAFRATRPHGSVHAAHVTENARNNPGLAAASASPARSSRASCSTLWPRTAC